VDDKQSHPDVFLFGPMAYGYLAIVIWPHSPELSHSEDGFGETTRSQPQCRAMDTRRLTM
jgi:hypothetical protein